MPDNKSTNNSDMSLEDIIADVMKKKGGSAPADKPTASPENKKDVLKDDSYLSDFELKDESFDKREFPPKSEKPKKAVQSPCDESDSELVALIASAMKNKDAKSDDASAPKKESTSADVRFAQSQANRLGGVQKSVDAAAVMPQAAVSKKGRGRRITSVAVCWILGILFIFCGIGLSLFGYYTGLLNRSDSSGGGTGGLSVNPVSDSDTMDEEELRKQLAEAQEAFVTDDNVTNILIIGEDIRDTADSTTGNTDVMMLVSINDETKQVVLTSLMRDMYVEIANSGGTYAKLNSAYSAGGAELTMKTLKNNFGIDVDKYVLFNFYSFIDIVDACGGIDIRISDEEAEGMQAPMAEQNDCLGNAEGTDYLTEGGTYHMNGNQALAYARLRYVGNADFERTARQRRVVSKIAEEAKDMSLVELSDLLDKVLRELETNLTDGEIAYLLYNSSTLLNYDIEQLRIPADGMYTNETIRGQAVLVVDFMDSIRLFQETVYGYTSVSDDDDDESSADSSTDDYDDYDTDTDYSYRTTTTSKSSGYNYFE